MSLNTKGSLINLSYMVKRKFNFCRQIEILPVSVIDLNARLFKKKEEKKNERSKKENKKIRKNPPPPNMSAPPTTCLFAP